MAANGLFRRPARIPCSIIFGIGVAAATPGSLDRLVLTMDDLDKARAELAERGVEVSESFPTPAEALRAAFTPAATSAPRVQISKAVLTARTPRSEITTAITTATLGCCKRLRCGFYARV
jgi:hypothetical protein